MRRRNLRIIFILLAAFSLVFSQVSSVYAADDNRESLEEYLEELKVQIESNNQTLDDIYNNIYIVNVKIAENNEYLEELNISLGQQKESMMKRIRYMYEAGASMDILLALLTSDSIADSLNKASYISQMISYDRDMLNNYVETINAIDETQTELEARKAELIELKDSFEDAKYEYASALEEATTRLEEYDIEASQVQEIMEEYLNVNEVSEIPDPDDIVIEDIDEETAYVASASDDEDSGESSYSTDRNDDEETSEDPGENDDYSEPDDSGDSDDSGDDDDDGDDGGSSYYVPISTYSYSEQEIYDLARVTYLEDGCVYSDGGSYRSIYLCACVILNRANNWYGGSISSAIYAGGQYATAYKYTSWGGGPLVINDITWQAVNDALSNCDPNPYYQCNGQHLAGMGLTEYYRDPVTDEVFYYGRD